MGDLLDKGSAWLESQRTLHMTRDVTYARGIITAVVKATIGRTEYETDDGQVVRTEFTDRDFLISVADLILNGTATLPEEGDQIREVQGSSVLIFEVMGWRYSDPYRRTFRLETKHVGTENL
jgi:hypothetical protein